MTKEEILKFSSEKGLSDIFLQFSDILGEPKGVWENIEEIESALEGDSSFDGSSIQGFARTIESDMYLRPDLNSFCLLPWHTNDIGNVGCFICDVHMPNGGPFEGDPRHILKTMLKKAEKVGFKYVVAAEYEFFLFSADENGEVVLKNGHLVPIDLCKYFGVNRDGGVEYRRTLIHNLKKMGVSAKKSHHEVAPGQQEIGLSHGDALKIADEIMITKIAIKAIAKQFGFFASFMPKPIEGKNGSGMHIHQNLTDLDGKNIFYDKNGLLNLSRTAKSFIAGQLKYIDEILAVLACEVNSYKRLVAGFEAPTYKSWAGSNRSALLRVPPFDKNRSKAARVELRCPDPKCNPYLALAMMLAAGLKGVEEDLEPPSRVEENIFQMCLEKRNNLLMPGSLLDALKCFEKSELVKETLGEHTFQKFLEVKRKEWRIFNEAVTNKELEMSL